MKSTGHDTLKTRQSLTAGGQTYHYFSIPEAAREIGDVSRLPVSLKVLLENVLRFEDGSTTTVEHAKSIAEWVKAGTSTNEVPFRPSRILMQDFTGVPAVVDLAAMRDGVIKLGGSPDKVNPLIPVDLVIDHSVHGGRGRHQGRATRQRRAGVRAQRRALPPSCAGAQNRVREFPRGAPRHRHLPPGQPRIPRAGVIWTARIAGDEFAYPDTLVGTDSHTTMVNGIGVLGWGVGGIEAEAAMLGQPISMLIPDVIGFRCTGKPGPGRPPPPTWC